VENIGLHVAGDVNGAEVMLVAHLDPSHILTSLDMNSSLSRVHNWVSPVVETEFLFLRSPFLGCIRPPTQASWSVSCNPWSYYRILISFVHVKIYIGQLWVPLSLFPCSSLINECHYFLLPSLQPITYVQPGPIVWSGWL
jgi:hypothetical protein